MNITLLANRDVASCLATNYLLQELGEHRLTLFLSSRVGSKALAEPLQQLKFVEQDLFNQVIFPLLDKSGEVGELAGFEQLHARLPGGVQVLNNINEPAGLEVFAASEPDLVLSVRYGVILKQPVLDVPRHGVLNLHSGRLPDYKGVMATFWALLHGEAELGTTLHRITDATIDTGPIVATSALPVDHTRSYLWHVLELYREGCRQMAAAAATLAAGAELATRDQPAGGNYFSFPGTAELARFSSQGWRLFDSEDITALAGRFQGSHDQPRQ